MQNIGQGLIIGILSLVIIYGYSLTYPQYHYWKNEAL